MKKGQSKPQGDEGVRVTIKEAWKTKIEGWKKSHGVVKPLAVLDAKNEPVVLFFRRPTRAELSAAESLATSQETGQVDLYKKAEKMMTDTFLDGDIQLQEVLDDIDLFMPLAKRILYELVAEKKTIWISC